MTASLLHAYEVVPKTADECLGDPSAFLEALEAGAKAAVTPLLEETFLE